MLKLLLLCSVPPSHIQPLRSVYLFSCCGCRRQTCGYREGTADAGLHPAAHWANKQLGFGPIPPRPPMLNPELVTGKGKADGCSHAALVITAESISFSLYLPGIATGTCWQHPVVLNENCPTSAFPCYLTPLLSALSVCPGWPGGAGHTAGPWARGSATLPSAALWPSGTSLADETPRFTGGFIGGLERMPSSCTGECRNHAVPSPPLTVTCSPVAAPSSPCGPQTSQTHKQTQFNNEVFKCANTLLHTEAAVANRNRCSISMEAVYSGIDANTGPHPARCCCSRGAENHVGGAEHLSINIFLETGSVCSCLESRFWFLQSVK